MQNSPEMSFLKNEFSYLGSTHLLKENDTYIEKIKVKK